MSYEEQLTAYAVTRLPVLIAAGLAVVTAARRWRADRTAAALLVLAGLCLLGHGAASCPVVYDRTAWGDLALPLTRHLFGWTDTSGGHWEWVDRWLLAAAAAGGLAAVFLRRDPADWGPT